MTNNSKHKTHISKTRKNKNFYIIKQIMKIFTQFLISNPLI